MYDRPTLRAVIQGIHELDLVAHDSMDLKGDMYEYLLSKLSQSGTNGQFRTPRHIVDLIVVLVDPEPRHRICDPARGTTGFLISAYNHTSCAKTQNPSISLAAMPTAASSNRPNGSFWKSTSSPDSTTTPT